MSTPTREAVLNLITELRPNTLIVEGSIHGNSLTVQVIDVDTLRTLATRAGVAYFSRKTWSEAVHELESAHPNVTMDGGEVVEVVVEVMHGGVLHRLLGSLPSFKVLQDAQHAEWDRELAAEEKAADERAERLDDIEADIEATLKNRLLDDKDWLVLEQDRLRRRHADGLVREQYPNEMKEQRVVTAIRGAIAEACEIRERTVIPAAARRFEAELSEHAEALATASGFAEATTRVTRNALARNYMAEVVPLVPAGAFLERLVTAATTSSSKL